MLTKGLEVSLKLDSLACQMHLKFSPCNKIPVRPETIIQPSLKYFFPYKRLAWGPAAGFHERFLNSEIKVDWLVGI